MTGRQQILASLLAMTMFGLSAACGTGPIEGLPDEQHERFVGEWAITLSDSPAAAAGRYTFEADGTVLNKVRPAAAPAHADSPDGQVSCALGDRWNSHGPTMLVVSGRCSDGRSRSLVFDFSADSGADGAGAGAVLRSVDGRSWSDDVWQWRRVGSF